jgi:hypothetical protein
MKTSMGFRQCGHWTGRAVEGWTAISASQPLHWKWIIGTMKPVIVIVLVATWVDAQTLADIARRERERRHTSQKATRVITAEGITPAPAAEAAPGEAAKPVVEGAGAKPADGTKPEPGGPAAVKAALAAPPKPDPVAEFNAQLEKVRQRFRDLQDQEASLQLQVSQATNEVFAPITDPDTQQRAQSRLGEIQQRLTGVRQELEQTRKALDTLQAQGPAKPQ